MSQKKTLREILKRHANATEVTEGFAVKYGHVDHLVREIEAWHRAALTQYGEQVREAIIDHIKRSNAIWGQAVDEMSALPLPPIEEGAS